jgi:membrane associated rhomboid family serine protease
VIPLRDANPTRRFALVTLAIVIACGVAFGWELGLLARGEAAFQSAVTEWGVVPARLTGAWGSGEFISVDSLTLVSSQFLHGGWLHLLGNLLYLWIFGNNVEDRLGRPGFLLFYLTGGVIAALAQVAIEPDSQIPTIGASGAIAAVLGAYLVFFPGARVTSLVFLGFFYQLVHIPAAIVLVLWFGLQLVSGFGTLGVSQGGGGVAFFAHIGGFIFGVVVGWLMNVLSGGRPVSRVGVG